MRKPPTLEQIKDELGRRMRKELFDMNEASRKDGEGSPKMMWHKSAYEALLRVMWYVDPLFDEQDL